MSTLVINDLCMSKELDRAAMIQVMGGWPRNYGRYIHRANRRFYRWGLRRGNDISSRVHRVRRQISSWF